MLVLDPVEGDAGLAVGFHDAGNRPAVHGFPQGADGRVVVFPGHQHFLGGLAELGLEPDRVVVQGGQGRISGLEDGDLGLELILVADIVLGHEMVGLLAQLDRISPVAPALPGQHRLADVDTPVIEQADLLDLGSSGRQQAAGRLAQGVVAQVTEVQGLVGVGAGEFDDDALALLAGGIAVIPALGGHGPQYLAADGRPVEAKQALADAQAGLQAGQEIVMFRGAGLEHQGQGRRHLGRSLAQALGERKQGKGQVTQFGFGRAFHLDEIKKSEGVYGVGRQGRTGQVARPAGQGLGDD